MTGAAVLTSETAKSPASKKATANFPQPKKAKATTEVAGTSPLAVSPFEMTGAAMLPEALREKSQRYMYLWQMVLTLEQEHSRSLKGAFLKIDDAEASVLNTEIKKTYMQEMEQQLSQNNIYGEVMNVLINLIQ